MPNHVDESVEMSDSIREMIQYRDSFPVLAKQGIKQVTPQSIIPAHWHDEFEFLYGITGTRLYTIGGNTIIVGPGEAMFVKRNVLHRLQNIHHEEVEFQVLLIHPSVLRHGPASLQQYYRLLVDHGNDYYHIDGSQPWHKPMMTAFAEMHDACTGQPAGYEITATLAAYQMLALLCDEIRKKPVDRSTVREDNGTAALRKMVQFIHTEYKRELTVPEIAASANISKSGCDKLFRRMLDQSPLEYLIDYRLSQSMTALASGSSVTEAALNNGFNSLSYFSHLFREKTGQTPSQYIKNTKR